MAAAGRLDGVVTLGPTDRTFCLKDDSMPLKPLSMGLGNPEAIAAICNQLGVQGVDILRGPFDELFAAARESGLPTNKDILLKESGDVPGASWQSGPYARPRYLIGGDRLGRRRCNGNQEFRDHEEHAPRLAMLEVPGGSILRMRGASVVVAADRVTAVVDVSSHFLPLIHVLDFQAEDRLNSARYIPGVVFVLTSELGETNYCHWLVDELPQLFLIRDRPEVLIAMADSPAPWRRQLLDLLSFPESRIILVGADDAIRADTVLVPNARELWHPARKGAAWVLEWLRSKVGFPAMARRDGRPDAGFRRLYVGRSDATTRHLTNEPELIGVLEAAGFQSITMEGRPVEEQVELFASAEVIIALHGAALANIVFCQSGTNILEIFSPYWGTPAYGILASAGGLRYASYCAEPGQHLPDERADYSLDVVSFWRDAEAWLRDQRIRDDRSPTATAPATRPS